MHAIGKERLLDEIYVNEKISVIKQARGHTLKKQEREKEPSNDKTQFHAHGGKKVHCHSFFGQWLWRNRNNERHDHNTVDLYKLKDDDTAILINKDSHRSMRLTIEKEIMNRIPYVEDKSISVSLKNPIELKKGETTGKLVVQFVAHFIVCDEEIDKFEHVGSIE